jgi:hypothetical protein
VGQAGLSLAQAAVYEILVQASVSEEFADILGKLRLH